MKVAGHPSKSSDVKKAIFTLIVMDEEAIDLFVTFHLKEADRKNYEKVFASFEKYVYLLKDILTFIDCKSTTVHGEPCPQLISCSTLLCPLKYATRT